MPAFETTVAAHLPPVINLQLGWPSTRICPSEELAKATAAALSDPEVVKAAMVYGPDLGHEPFRKSIAKWLSEFYSYGSIPFDRIAITGGASQNLASVLQVFTDPNVTKRIWMVEPTYFMACTIFQDAGFTGSMKGVPEDEHGFDMTFFRNALEEFENGAEQNGSTPSLKPASQYAKLFRHVLYITPTFSNPSAKTMSVPHRKQLLELAREFDILIISDDVYDFLKWNPDSTSSAKLAPIPPRFVDLDRATSEVESWGNSISNGSFSKIVAPGVRVGWAEASAKMTLRLSENGPTRSGGAPSHLTSTFIHHMLHSGALQKHIDDVLIPTYNSRYQVMMTAIRTFLEPLGVMITIGAPYMIPETDDVAVPAGGFFTYLTFPPQLPRADIVAKRAWDEYSLKIAFGKMFEVMGDEGSTERAKDGFGRGVRLSWAWHESAEIAEGIVRLSNLLKAMLAEVNNAS